jgi:hypothetical protein
MAQSLVYSLTPLNPRKSSILSIRQICRVHPCLQETARIEPSNVVILQRTRILVNVDGKRRVYDGCYAGWGWQWSNWGELESMKFLKPDADPEARLQFWQGLNDYAVKA